MFEKTDQDKFNRADEETAHCGVHGRQKPGNLHFGEVAFSLNDWFVTARLLIQHMTSVRVSLRNCDTCCDTEVNRVVSFVREKKNGARGTRDGTSFPSLLFGVHCEKAKTLTNIVYHRCSLPVQPTFSGLCCGETKTILRAGFVGCL